MLICFHFLLHFRYLPSLFFLHLSAHTADVTKHWSVPWDNAETKALVSGGSLPCLCAPCPFSSGLHWESWASCLDECWKFSCALPTRSHTSLLWGLSLPDVYFLILLGPRSSQYKYADSPSCAKLPGMGRWHCLYLDFMMKCYRKQTPVSPAVCPVWDSLLPRWSGLASNRTSQALMTFGAHHVPLIL